MTTPPAAAPPATGDRPLRVWDLVATIVLMLLSAGLGLLLLVFAPFLAMASDGCSGVVCNDTQMGLGFMLALIGPPLVIVAGLITAIVLLARRRLAFWVPLAASALAIGVLFLGAVIVVGAIPGATL